jgi:hypothetical protein
VTNLGFVCELRPKLIRQIGSSPQELGRNRWPRPRHWPRRPPRSTSTSRLWSHGSGTRPRCTTSKTFWRKSRWPGVDVMIEIFCYFWQFSAKKLAFFSKTNVMLKILYNLALFWVKNAIFCNFFGENIFKIITSVPDCYIPILLGLVYLHTYVCMYIYTKLWLLLGLVYTHQY